MFGGHHFAKNAQQISTLSNIRQTLRKRCGPALQMLAYKTGIMALMGRLRQTKGAIILMYHSVADDSQSQFIDPDNHVPADVFGRQMYFLSKYRKVVSLKALVRIIQKGEAPSDGTVVITFDDGYLDNLTIAAPILEHYKLPATLFLPTGYIDRGENQWIDQTYTAFKHRSKAQLVWEAGAPAKFKLDEPWQYRAAYKAVCADLLTAEPENRRLRLAEVCDQLQPTTRAPRLTMTWDDVKTLLERYCRFEIGGHTLEHTDLTSVAEVQAKRELSDCIQRIKDETGVQPQYFSFCYGRTSESLRSMAAGAGFEAACGGEGQDPVIKDVADCFRLPRVAAPPSMQKFELITNTTNNGIWRKLGR